MRHEERAKADAQRPRSGRATGTRRQAVPGMETRGRQSAVQRAGAARAERRSAARHRARQGCRGGDKCRRAGAAVASGSAPPFCRVYGEPLCRRVGPRPRARLRPRCRAVIGWLLDTNVVSTIINPNGAPTVKAWAAAQDEGRFFLSILTLGEYDKGLHNVSNNHPNRLRFIAARDGLAARFAGRTLSVGDAIVRRWGVISGTTRRVTGHSPPVIDTLFAATALEYDLYLVTRNGSDVQTSGAQIFDPWNDDPAKFPLSPLPRSLL